MMFYVIFALTVLASRRVAVALASLALLAAVIAGRIGQPTSDLLSYWSNPIVIEFLFGMAIALAYRDGFRLPQPVAVVAVLAGLAAVLIANATMPVFETRVIFIGIPAAVMVAGATFGGFSLRGPVWTALATVGDASYALYLFHSFAVRGVILLAGRLGLDIARHPWPYLAAAVIGSIALAVFLHYAFERPVTRLLRRLTDRAPPLKRHAQPVT
jgi:peptidoglycan/LPS O-acetylase OafA/YrhL